MFSKKIKYEILIDGMMCENCTKHVKNALKAIAGVNSVDVSLSNKKATITAKKELDLELIKRQIEELDYSVISISIV